MTEYCFYNPDDRPCTNCGVLYGERKGQWWHLNNYYGISGFYCPKCWDKVARDSYGNLKYEQKGTV